MADLWPWLLLTLPAYVVAAWFLPALMRPVFWLVAHGLYRFTVYHRDRIPATGPAIIAPEGQDSLADRYLSFELKGDGTVGPPSVGRSRGDDNGCVCDWHDHRRLSRTRGQRSGRVGVGLARKFRGSRRDEHVLCRRARADFNRCSPES